MFLFYQHMKDTVCEIKACQYAYDMLIFLLNLSLNMLINVMLIKKHVSKKSKKVYRLYTEHIC